MKKTAVVDDDPLDAEFDFSKGRPNPYWLGLVDRSCVRLLDKDLSAIFADNRAVNEALRTLVRIRDSAGMRKISAKTAAAPKSPRKKVRS